MEIKSIDREAFIELYELYAEKVYQIALYYSGSSDTAEEITQDVFAKLYINKDRVNIDHAGAWLKATAKNDALNYNRDYTDRIEVDENINTKIERVVDNSCEDEFFSKLIHQEHAEFVNYILKEVYEKKPRWNEALVLLYIQNKSFEETAKSMKISVGALHVMLHRIRKWMRKRYQKKFDHLDKI